MKLKCLVFLVSFLLIIQFCFPSEVFATEFTHEAYISGADNYLDGSRRVAISGNYAYVVSYMSAALVAFDISDIANGNITKKAHISGSGSPNYLNGAMGMHISGDYIYVASYGADALVAFDISDIANGNITKKAHISGWANYLHSPSEVYVSGDYAYVVAAEGASLAAFDISDVANGNITKKAHISGTGDPNYLQSAMDVYVSGDYAYVTASVDDSFVVFDISDVANGNITKKAHISGVGSPNYLDGAYDIYISNNYAYVASYYNDAFVVFDISDIANGNITKKAHISGVGSPNYLDGSANVIIEGNYAYVAGRAENSLGVFDISDVANGNITLEDSIQGSGSPNYLDGAYGLAKSGNYIYVASFDDDTLSVFEFVTNTAPTATEPSSVSQVTNGTGYISFQSTITDTDGDTCTVKVEYSDDGGSNWYDPILVSVSGDETPTIDNDEAYQVRAVTSTSDNNTLTIIWNTLSASNGNGTLDGTSQSDIQVRVTANDGTVDATVQTSSSFSVDDLDPSVSTYFPTDDATGVTTTANLILTFDEAVDAELGNITLYDSNNTEIEALDVTSDISGSGEATITINPTSDLSYETQYYVQIDATAFDDASGNSYAGISDTATWSFTTENTPLCDTIDNAATYNAWPTCGVATCNDGYTLVDGACIRVGGGAPAPPPAIGLGHIDASIPMGGTGSVGEIDSQGVNVLSYINSHINFEAIVSSTNLIQNHNYQVSNLDLLDNVVTLTFYSEPKNVTLTLGETRQIDLDQDNISDVEVKFVDLIVNRIEITIKSLLAKTGVEGYEGRLVKYSNSPKVYLIQDDKKRWVTSEETFNYYKYKWNEIMTIEDDTTFEYGLDITKLTQFNYYQFTRDLRLGMSGEDIKELQKYLNQNGFKLAETSYGSPGNETTYFGSLTKAAVSAFQKANGIYPTAGYFGPITRGFLVK